MIQETQYVVTEVVLRFHIKDSKKIDSTLSSEVVQEELEQFLTEYEHVDDFDIDEIIDLGIEIAPDELREAWQDPLALTTLQRQANITIEADIDVEGTQDVLDIICRTDNELSVVEDGLEEAIDLIHNTLMTVRDIRRL